MYKKDLTVQLQTQIIFIAQHILKKTQSYWIKSKKVPE